MVSSTVKSSSLETAGQILIRAIRGEHLADRSLPPADTLLEAARSHGVVLALNRAFPHPVIKAAAQRERAITLRLTAAAVEVSGWLAEAGLPHALVKGPALAAAFPNGEREFVDVDVLVEPQLMSMAILTLQDHGAQVLDGHSWPREDGVGELPLGLPSGVSIDLHADLIHHEQVRREFALRVGALLQRATHLPLMDANVPVLDPEDSLICVALHATLSGGDRLIWLADLDALVGSGTIRWDVLIERAASAQLELVVGVMLSRAKTVLGTPVPPDVLNALTRGGRGWCWLLAVFERLRPTSGSHVGFARGQILVRATRNSTKGSLWALLRLIGEEVVLFVIRDPSHPWRHRLRERLRKMTSIGTR